MGISHDPDRSDVAESALDHAVLTVGTTAVEVKVGGSRLATRQIVVIYNESNSKNLYWGKSGVTNSGATRGFPILPGQFVSLPFGNVGVFVVADQAAQTAIVAEVG